MYIMQYSFQCKIQKEFNSVFTTRNNKKFTALANVYIKKSNKDTCFVTVLMNFTDIPLDTP